MSINCIHWDWWRTLGINYSFYGWYFKSLSVEVTCFTLLSWILVIIITLIRWSKYKWMLGLFTFFIYLVWMFYLFNWLFEPLDCLSLSLVAQLWRRNYFECSSWCLDLTLSWIRQKSISCSIAFTLLVIKRQIYGVFTPGTVFRA